MKLSLKLRTAEQKAIEEISNVYSRLLKVRNKIVESNNLKNHQSLWEY